MSQTFHGTWEVKEEIFLQAPCTSQAPFHAPIRGGYRGEGRLPKWTAQIPRKAYRWALRGDLKIVFWP